MMNIEQEIQNVLDRNFTRGDNANALKELLVLYNAVEQSEQLLAFFQWYCNYKNNIHEGSEEKIIKEWIEGE